MTSVQLLRRRRARWCLSLLALMVSAIGVSAQVKMCEDALPGYVIRSVEVKVRWRRDLAVPLKRNDPITTENLSAARKAVIEAISREVDEHISEFIKMNKLPAVASATAARSCSLRLPENTCRAEGLGDKCADVEIQAFTVTTNPVSTALNLLPIPRSNEYTFLSSVPVPLRVLNPKFGAGFDRELGFTPQAEISTDLLSLGEKKGGNDDDSGNRASLLLKAGGSKSVDERFYTSRAELSWLLRQPSEQFESVGVETSFSASHLPQKDGRHFDNSFRLGGHVIFNPTRGIMNRVALSGAYRHSSQRLLGGGTQPNILTVENGFEGRALLEGRVWNGFTRLGVWFDAMRPERLTGNYRRAAALLGYEKEIPVGGHTVGVEALLGAGWASSHTPDYAQFYGGSSLNSFLYEDILDPSTKSLPGGPLLRSFGQNQAGALLGGGQQRGAKEYQHFNLTVSIPIPGLSRPLIPNEVAFQNSQGKDVALRTIVKTAVENGELLLSLNLQEGGLSEEEADRKAAQIFREVKPGVNYLVDYGKLWAVKPLFMFDEARLSRPGGTGAHTRYAVGGGIQLTLVVAKFEAGYVRALRRLDGDRRGNFVARLVFQNLF